MPEYVGLDYVAHADTETIVFGHDLENGMRVLIADTLVRGNPDQKSKNIYDRTRLDETAAWCTVTKLKIRGLVQFVGVYDDGSMRVRQYAPSYGWIVKLDSIPE